jgi:hypothetical protein
MRNDFTSMPARKGESARRRRPVAYSLFAGWLTLLMGCATAEPRSAPPPSVLEQAVDAMEREEWHEADELIEEILPPPPQENVSRTASAWHASS